jgi:mycoredoxin
MDLTVYSALSCPDCREAKRFLAKYNIPYKEIDVQSTPGAIDEIVKRTGKRAIPQFVIDGEWFQPYDPHKGLLYDEMAKRLGIKTP